jgi:hypothetical protein
VGPDGTIWTAGLEKVNGNQPGALVDPNYGVIRHFDRTGKLLGSFIPRSTFSSQQMVMYGMLRSVRGRVGWYTGPIAGPGSQYYEILSDGTIRKYPSIELNKSEYVTGLALMDDGSTYVTIYDSRAHAWRCLSTGGPDQQWTSEILPTGVWRADLYGGDGQRLVFHTTDRFSLIFVSASR